ncbi:hypothetical protein ABZ468_25865 [Streptomyces sp. NPDC005708]|uniref:hypothetical protein n=1 Tax=Streptomyces sp. NPDC005708 TaxID=3154564 RepID=UPI00341184DE
MSTEVLVGVIGLCGALVGAAAAFVGVVYQQKQQVKLAQAERRDALAQLAVDTIMTELEELRRLVWSVSGDAEEPPEFRPQLVRHIDVIRLGVLRLPHQELREAMEAACMMEFGRVDQFQEHIGLRLPRIVATAMCWDAQKCLGAYLRREPLPETTFLFKARDYFHSVISQRR